MSVRPVRSLPLKVWHLACSVVLDGNRRTIGLLGWQHWNTKPCVGSFHYGVLFVRTHFLFNWSRMRTVWQRRQQKGTEIKAWSLTGHARWCLCSKWGTLHRNSHLVKTLQRKDIVWVEAKLPCKCNKSSQMHSYTGYLSPLLYHFFHLTNKLHLIAN